MFAKFLINYNRVSTGHWKTLKVVKFKNFIFQALKVMENKSFVCYNGGLVAADVKVTTEQDKRQMNVVKKCKRGTF